MVWSRWTFTIISGRAPKKWNTSCVRGYDSNGSSELCIDKLSSYVRAIVLCMAYLKTDATLFLVVGMGLVDDTNRNAALDKCQSKGEPCRACTNLSPS